MSHRSGPLGTAAVRGEPRPGRLDGGSKGEGEVSLGGVLDVQVRQGRCHDCGALVMSMEAVAVVAVAVVAGVAAQLRSLALWQAGVHYLLRLKPCSTFCAALLPLGCSPANRNAHVALAQHHMPPPFTRLLPP